MYYIRYILTAYTYCLRVAAGPAAKRALARAALVLDQNRAACPKRKQPLPATGGAENLWRPAWPRRPVAKSGRDAPVARSFGRTVWFVWAAVPARPTSPFGCFPWMFKGFAWMFADGTWMQRHETSMQRDGTSLFNGFAWMFRDQTWMQRRETSMQRGETSMIGGFAGMFKDGTWMRDG